MRTIFDPAELTERTSALEDEMGEAGFWDDQERAAKVSAEHARATRKLSQFRGLESDVEDLEPLAEMAEEDPEMAVELEEQLVSVQQRLDALEEERLFSGPYDAGDALVTVNAGAGGTDAQDWAEMVLRMEMRWAEKRGFGVEMLEASPGEEAGIKSATFRARGENAYGLYGSEKGVHRLVRLSPFDSANRRQTSFAGVEVSPVVRGDRRCPDRGRRPPDRHLPGQRRRWPARQQDRFGGPDHAQADRASWCNARTSARSRPIRPRRWRCCAPSWLELEERKRREEIARERGEAQDVNFGSQIRSYVLHPYTMVKDHRTDHFEMGDANRVLDGDLDGFIRAYLLESAKSWPTK